MAERAREPDQAETLYDRLQQRHRELLVKYRAAVERHAHSAMLGHWLVHNAHDGVALLHDGGLRTANRHFHRFCSRARRWKRVSSATSDREEALLPLLFREAERLPEDADTVLRAIFQSERPCLCLVEATLQRLDDCEGNVVVLLRDMTESELLRRQVEEAGHRDQFLAMLAHELRNPLAPIVSAAEMILRSEDREQIRRAAQTILSQGQHQANLVADLLDTARVRQGKVTLRRRPEDLRRLIQEAFSATAQVREAHAVHGKLALPEEPVCVYGDRTRLEQCLVNLLHNAAKFTLPGGFNEVELETSGDFAWIRVRDNGVGMDPSILPRVFEVFTQGDVAPDRSQGGLGLGLALVKNLVELHGGGVRARSAGKGCGAEFTVWLPRVSAPCFAGAGPAEAPAAGPSPATARAPVRRRVLLVEDNAAALETLADLLEGEGHEVLTACSGPQGVELASRETPDTVITDIGLPGCDGYQLAREVRAVLPNVTLIALTGYSGPSESDQVRQATFDAFLVKPVDFRTLIRTLDERRHPNGAG